MSNKTGFSQDNVHAVDNIMMFITSLVIRLRRHKIDKNGESQYDREKFICTRNLKHLLERAFYIYVYKVSFTFQLKTLLQFPGMKILKHNSPLIPYIFH